MSATRRDAQADGVVMTVKVTDPNWSSNDGDYEFPLAAHRGFQIALDGDWVDVRETIMIQDEDHFRELHAKWKAMHKLMEE
jgi:hypothetical protein